MKCERIFEHSTLVKKVEGITRCGHIERKDQGRTARLVHLFSGSFAWLPIGLLTTLQCYISVPILLSLCGSHINQYLHKIVSVQYLVSTIKNYPELFAGSEFNFLYEHQWIEILVSYSNKMFGMLRKFFRIAFTNLLGFKLHQTQYWNYRYTFYIPPPPPALQYLALVL